MRSLFDGPFTRILAYSACCLALALSSCKKDDEEAPVQKGSIVGYTRAFTETGDRTDDAGTIVAVEGQSKQAVSDANGRFELSDVAAGTHNLLFTRPNFSATRRPSVVHVGGSAPTFVGQVAMSPPSRVSFSNLSAVTQSPGVTFSVDVSSPTQDPQVRVMAMANTGVAPDFSKARFVKGLYMAAGTGTAQRSGSIFHYDFEDAGFTSGETAHLFLVALPMTFDAYLSPDTGNPVYAGMGQPSNSQTIRVP